MPDSAGWRLSLAETVTGHVICDLPLTGTPTWGRAISGHGALSGVQVALDPRLDQDDATAMLTPWRYTALLSRGNWIAQAGILEQARVDDSQQPASAELTCVTLWDLVSRKRPATYYMPSLDFTDGDIVFGPTSPDPANRSLSWGGVARRLLEITSGGPGFFRPGLNSDATGTGMQLPIVLPNAENFPPGTNGPVAVTYTAADQAQLGERLDDCVKAGVEMELDPVYTDTSQTYFQWNARISDGRLGQLGFPHYFDYGKALQYLAITMDGSDMTFYQIVKGQDTRQPATATAPASGELIWSYSSDVTPSFVGAGWPALITADTSNHSSETSYAVCNQIANQDVQTHQYPAYTGTATFRLDALTIDGRQTGSPSIDAIDVGDTTVLAMDDHPILPDGQTAARFLTLGNGGDPYTAVADLQLLGQV